MIGQSVGYPLRRIEDGIGGPLRPPTTAIRLLEVLRAPGKRPLRALAACRARLIAKLYQRMAFPVF